MKVPIGCSLASLLKNESLYMYFQDIWKLFRDTFSKDKLWKPPSVFRAVLLPRAYNNILPIYLTTNLRDIETLDWCLAASALSQGQNVPSGLDLVFHPSNDGLTIKIPYRVDFLLHSPASHPIFLYWVGQNWVWFLDKCIKTFFSRL